MKINVYAILPITMLLLFGCNSHKTEQKKRIDVSEVPLQLKFSRFDYDLMNSDTITSQKVALWKQSYKSFFYYYCRRIMPVPVKMTSDSAIVIQLNAFKNDKDIQDIYSKVKLQYNDLAWLQKDLTDVFKHYKHYYPDSIIPSVITFISAFNYQVITTDSVVGIGLDYYLGSDCPFYEGMDFPNYLLKRLRREYISVNCIQGWYQKEYDVNKIKNELLSQMVYYGKMIYFTDMMSPAMPDSIKLGFDNSQVNWCKENEANIWSALIESKMLYSANLREYMKFINDGPTTSGFPKESPSRLGYYTGWQIVKAFMENHPEYTLAQLCNEEDAQKILVESKYKPEK